MEREYLQMNICKRLPGTDNTLQFISNWFEDYYIRKAMDERFLTNHYVVYTVMDGIMRGGVQCYGVFDVKDDKAESFLGMAWGWIKHDNYFEVHFAFDRGVNTMECARLCLAEMKKHNPDVKGVVGYIPDSNRAARMFAKRFGCKDNGIRPEQVFIKNGMAYSCREFRIEA